ncbi:MAG: hypothetical protein NZ769_11215 [Anaerolineae bacterium]|nr:hypothetical protein [Anaerolineae bacterium]
MKGWRIGITGLALIVLLLTGLTRYERTLFFPDRPAEAYPTLPLRNFHRLLVIAPHCDDEVLGPGGLIRAALRRGMDVREGSLTVLSQLGLDPEKVFFLTYPERRLPVLWWQRWDQPDRSPFTGQEASPYPRAYRLGTSYQGKALLEDLLDILGSFRSGSPFRWKPEKRLCWTRQVGTFSLCTNRV